MKENVISETGQATDACFHGMQRTRRLLVALTTAVLAPGHKRSTGVFSISAFIMPKTRSSRLSKNPRGLPQKRSRSSQEAPQGSGEKPKPKPWFTVFTKGDAEYDRYMSTEWGFEKRGDVPLFEKLCLEGAQSGLSWLTILRKREAYRSVFHHFDPDQVARMTEDDVERILSTEGDPRDVVVRHGGKIRAVIQNAQCILKLRKDSSEQDAEPFDTLLWSFVDDKPILNRLTNMNSAPSKSAESEAMSKALKKLGFKFVGPTTCYSLMQSMGMVIDHPFGTPEWEAARRRLEERPGGYQEIPPDAP